MWFIEEKELGQTRMFYMKYRRTSYKRNSEKIRNRGNDIEKSYII